MPGRSVEGPGNLPSAISSSIASISFESSTCIDPPVRRSSNQCRFEFREVFKPRNCERVFFKEPPETQSFIGRESHRRVAATYRSISQRKLAPLHPERSNRVVFSIGLQRRLCGTKQRVAGKAKTPAHPIFSVPVVPYSQATGLPIADIRFASIRSQSSGESVAGSASACRADTFVFDVPSGRTSSPVPEKMHLFHLQKQISLAEIGQSGRARFRR